MSSKAQPSPSSSAAPDNGHESAHTEHGIDGAAVGMHGGSSGATLPTIIRRCFQSTPSLRAFMNSPG